MAKDTYKWELSVSVNVRNIATDKITHVFTTSMFPATKKAAMEISAKYRQLLETVSGIYTSVANHIFGVE